MVPNAPSHVPYTELTVMSAELRYPAKRLLPGSSFTIARTDVFTFSYGWLRMTWYPNALLIGPVGTPGFASTAPRMKSGSKLDCNFTSVWQSESPFLRAPPLLSAPGSMDFFAASSANEVPFSRSARTVRASASVFTKMWLRHNVPADAGDAE